MLWTRWVPATLALAALTGCGGGDARPAAKRTATPVAYPVAYAVARDELAALAEEPLPDAVEGAEVVATSTWQP